MAKKTTSRGRGGRGSDGRSKGARPLDHTCRVAILHGADEFLRGECTKQLRDALKSAHGDALDVIRFDGSSATPAEILDELHSFGLMAAHKLIIVDEADQFLAADPEASSRVKSARELMEGYAKDPSDGATLVLRARTWRAGKLDKAVEPIGRIVSCAPPDPEQATSWAQTRATKRHDVKLDREAAAMLVRFTGADLGRVDTELAKLALTAVDGAIPASAVEAMTGVTREDEFFTLQNALLSGDRAGALEHLRELIDVSRHDPVPLMYALLDLAVKVHHTSAAVAQGANARSLAGKLRIWPFEKADAIARVASSVKPDQAAQLLRRTVRTDRRLKSGLADSRRAVEVLTATFPSRGR